MARMTDIPDGLSTDTTGVSRSEYSGQPEAELPLAPGGFAPRIRVMTVDGPAQVTDLTPGERVFALDPTTRLVKPQRLVAIERVPHEAPLVTIRTQRADLCIAPGHRIPYRTEANERIRIRRADELDKQYYKFISEWTTRAGSRIETVDSTEHLDSFEACAAAEQHGHTRRAALPDGCVPCRRNSHTGYYFDAATFKRFQSTIEDVADEVTVHAAPGHRRRPYRFDGDDFLELLGWFAAEGSIYWSNDRNTAEVKIAQETAPHRSAIVALFDRLGIDVQTDDRSIRFGSALFGHLLERLCGADSRSKRLPDLVWRASRGQRRALLDTLLKGDGNERATYYTTSEQLASDVMRLGLDCGVKPRYTRRDGIWQLYLRSVNDGFQAEHRGTTADPDVVYRLTVANYGVVMAGREGKFQWIGTSVVA